MPRTKRKRSSRKQPQRYDTSFKVWVEQQAHDVLPWLLPGTVYEETLNVETARSMVRADKVFKVLYYGEEHTLSHPQQKNRHEPAPHAGLCLLFILSFSSLTAEDDSL
jgi:hypothetical protein